MAKKKIEIDSLDAALEKEGKFHAEVEYYIDSIAYKKSSSLTASYIERLYSREMLEKICTQRIIKLPEITENEELNNLSCSEICDLLLNKKLNKEIFSGELVGGLVQQTGSYEEVRGFLRNSKLFQTFSDMYS